MNREIKFRAWDKHDNEWVDNVFLDADGSVRYFGHDAFEVDDINEFEISLYTGLKDKNGVEIYEGDIIRCLDGWAGEVFWDELSLQWWAADHDLSTLNQPKVVGNIYENPELLKETSSNTQSKSTSRS